MRKRIMQIARGKFEYDSPDLSFSENEINIEVPEGTTTSGTFQITSVNGQMARGIVYSSAERMKCDNPFFEGINTTFCYEFYSKGLKEGDIQKGQFIVLCNRKEYSLPFCVRIVEKSIDSSIGKIASINDFTNLAKHNWKEAGLLFYSDKFPVLLEKESAKTKMLYEGFSSGLPYGQHMEEFLVGTNQKKIVEIETTCEKMDLFGVQVPRKESLEIRKNQWGYIKIDVKSDLCAVKPVVNQISEEDFIGDTYRLDLFIDNRFLHAGNNYANVILETQNQKKVIPICINTDLDLDKEVFYTRKEQKELYVKASRLYQSYKLKHTVTGVWTRDTIAILDRLSKVDPQNGWYQLFTAYCLLQNKQRQDAEWILKEYKRNCQRKDNPEWAFYLYILTLYEKEPVFVEQMTEKIESIYRMYPNNSIIFWVLLQLHPEYRMSYQKKWSALCNWIQKNNAPFYLMAELCVLIQEDPYHITKLTSFEIWMFHYMLKHGALTKEVAEQILSLAKKYGDFSKDVLQLLEKSYEYIPTKENLSIVCGYLIKGQQFQIQHHKWYEKAIYEELSIAGIYEAYLLSMDEHKIVQLPRIIQMYFQYESRLPYQKLAALYNNIIAQKEKQKEIYLKYRQTIGSFALNQIRQGHIDENLAVIYQDIFPSNLIDEKTAVYLSKILFVNKIWIAKKDIAKVYVYYDEINRPQIVSVTNQIAYISIYTKNYALVFEDLKGNLYSGDFVYEIQPLMPVSLYLETCLEHTPKDIFCCLCYMKNKKSYLDFEQKDLFYIKMLLDSSLVRDTYKSRKLFDYVKYLMIQRQDSLIVESLKNIDFELLDFDSRNYFIHLLSKYELDDLLENAVKEYGTDSISKEDKVKFLERSLKKEDVSEEICMDLACSVFSKDDVCDEEILQYLSEKYQGSSDDMNKIFVAAYQKENVNTKSIEERMLVQMLYSNQFLDNSDAVFSSYYNHHGTELVIEAYLAAKSQLYFIENQIPDEDVFEAIWGRCYYEQFVCDICKIALLKHYSEFSEMEQSKFQVAESILKDFIKRNIYFAFYKKLDHRLIMKYHLYDKVFLEYRTKSKSQITIHYSKDEDGADFSSEVMNQSYDGIYVKTFVMFFGEMIQYYITEDDNGKVNISESNRLINNNIYNEKDKCRYNLLNEILISRTLLETNKMEEDIEKYEKLNLLTEKMFHLI